MSSSSGKGVVTRFQSANGTSESCSLPLVLEFRHTIVRRLLSQQSLKLLDLLPSRITDKIRVNLTTWCWEWQGELRKGYGRVNYYGTKWSVHRLTYETLRGKIKDEHDHLMHMCENRRCCNPWHAKPGTNSSNQLHFHKMRRKEQKVSQA